MFDFIVVGARCAGASVANFLGQYGYSVLLIDKYSSPGPTLSTHIIGETDVYDRLGIREKMENAGAPAITRMRVDLEGCVFESDLYVTTRVLGLRRELLDRYLLDAASALSSVTVLLDTKVIDTLIQDGKVIGVRCLNKDGFNQNYYGGIIVGADGSRSMIARTVRAEQLTGTNENHSAVYYIYASQIEPLPIPTVEWYWHRDNVILCNPIDQSMHCIAFMLSLDEFESWKDDIVGSFKNRLRKIKTLAPRIQKMQVEGSPRGISHLSSYVKQSYGEGWALVGDSAAHLHPIAGVGIDNAVCCAEYLAIEMNDYRLGKKTWDEAMISYIQKRDERIHPQLTASLQTLSQMAKPLTNENHEQLKMLCSFPGLVKELGSHVQNIFQLLSESKAALGAQKGKQL